MEPIKKPEDLWFNTPDVHTLCRAGGNGPNHPSQLYAIRKYVDKYMTFLDIGCGSATTLEAMLKSGFTPFYYKGVDFIPKNVEWCKKQFPDWDFEVQDATHLKEEDGLWDVVYSRHVVDHLPSFEIGLDEHCRVSKRFVIIVLWRPFVDGTEHQIKNIVENGKVYKDEYTNDYSRQKVMEALNSKKGWIVREVTEGVGREVKGFDTIIVLEKEEIE